mmetsp:Transcript_40900/g.102332  ORF Transcript_40900/g.102332 Transcript_40900/m.102332 type:complete len:116 (+) Transcript_40900:56-403(+)
MPPRARLPLTCLLFAVPSDFSLPCALALILLPAMQPPPTASGIEGHAAQRIAAGFGQESLLSCVRVCVGGGMRPWKKEAWAMGKAGRGAGKVWRAAVPMTAISTIAAGLRSWGCR